MGPFSANMGAGGGNIRLTDDDAKALDVEILIAPDWILGLSTMLRLRAIADWLWTDILPKQTEDYSLICHGDIFPVRRMSLDELLSGQPVATWVQAERGAKLCPLTWLLATRKAFDLGCLPSTMENCPQVAGYSARPASRGDVPGGEYGGDLNFEWLEPGWVHSCQQSMSNAWPDLHRRKMAMVSTMMRAMGVTVPDYGAIGQRIEGLRHHAPRAANGIPSHLLPETALGCSGCGQ
jgi:hypothetical protein